MKKNGLAGTHRNEFGAKHVLTDGASAGADRLLAVVSAVALLLPLALLAVLLLDTFIDGAHRLSWEFLTSLPSRFASKAGILPALLGSMYLMALTAALSLPLGVAAAVYLEEYAADNRLTRFVEINISNLAGVPSVIFGLLGLGILVRAAGMGRSLLAGAMTLSFMLLPTIIMATREALRTVPVAIKEGAYALGAYRWRIILRVILPICLPGIITGAILSLARAVGETAPLITIGALTYMSFVPDSINGPFTALPIQIFNWISRPQKEFHINAAAAIIVLLVIMIVMNAAAIIIRYRMQKRVSW